MVYQERLETHLL